MRNIDFSRPITFCIGFITLSPNSGRTHIETKVREMDARKKNSRGLNSLIFKITAIEMPFTDDCNLKLNGITRWGTLLFLSLNYVDGEGT